MHGGLCSAFSHPVGIQSRQVPWTVWHEGWPIFLQSVWAACGDRRFPEVDLTGSKWPKGVASYTEMRDWCGFKRILSFNCFHVFFFFNRAFEDETMKLRQLKLDNQVSRVSSSERCGQLILTRKLVGLTVATARPKHFEDISIKTGLGFIVTEDSLASVIRIRKMLMLCFCVVIWNCCPNTSLHCNFM